MAEQELCMSTFEEDRSIFVKFDEYQTILTNILGSYYDTSLSWTEDGEAMSTVTGYTIVCYNSDGYNCEIQFENKDDKLLFMIQM